MGFEIRLDSFRHTTRTYSFFQLLFIEMQVATGIFITCLGPKVVYSSHGLTIYVGAVVAGQSDDMLVDRR